MSSSSLAETNPIDLNMLVPPLPLRTPTSPAPKAMLPVGPRSGAIAPATPAVRRPDATFALPDAIKSEPEVISSYILF